MVYFVAICYILGSFGMLYEETSGNPAYMAILVAPTYMYRNPRSLRQQQALFFDIK
jgi:hypothetical protein